MISTWAKDLNKINLTPVMETQLANYYEMLKSGNAKINLTTITKEVDVYYKHFYDALLISNELTINSQNFCDVGSGAGIPGLVLKICFPNLHLTIIESNTKKCQFLQKVVTALTLKNVNIFNERVEIFAHYTREKFDIVTARALAPLNILNELCLPLVKINGLFIAYKSSKIGVELDQAQNSIITMKAKLVNQFSYELPEEYGTRTILHFQKFQLCPIKYPRLYQQIKSKPL